MQTGGSEGVFALSERNNSFALTALSAPQSPHFSL